MKLNDKMPGYARPRTTLEKLLVLVDHLKYRRRKSLKELSHLLEKSERQIRRDIQTLERYYALDFDEYNRPFILVDKHEDELVIHLTAEEMTFLHDLVEHSRHRLAEGLRQKLDLNLGINLESRHTYAEMIDLLEQAINDRRQVILRDYQSANAKHPRDIRVEPIHLTEFKFLSAYDPTAEKTKVYSLERMSAVTITDDSYAHDGQHVHVKPDPFGMSAGKPELIHLFLTTRAYLLMREEFPRSRQCLKETGESDYPYRFEGYVYAYEGIGRFVAGLPNEVLVREPASFVDYIRNLSQQHDINYSQS